MKFGIKQFKEPTPKKMKQLGAALLAISVFTAGTGALLAPAYWQWIVFLLGATGTGLTTFFGGEK